MNDILVETAKQTPALVLMLILAGMFLKFYLSLLKGIMDKFQNSLDTIWNKFDSSQESLKDVVKENTAVNATFLEATKHCREKQCG